MSGIRSAMRARFWAVLEVIVGLYGAASVSSLIGNTTPLSSNEHTLLWSWN